MLPKNANLFDDQDILEEFVGPHSLILNDPDSVWLVDSGIVDVFGIELENNTIAGSQDHILRSEPGDILFGMDVADENNFGFMAIVKAGDRLLKLHRSHLVEKAKTSDKKNSVATLIDQWVQALTLGMSNQAAKGFASRTNPPYVYLTLKSGEEIILDEGENAYPDQGVLWVRHLQGCCHLMGREELALTVGDSFFPVNSLAWLKCDQHSRIQVMETSTIIDQEAVWVGLEGFHQLIRVCSSSIHQQKERTEQQRLEIKNNQDHLAAERSMNELASILNTDVSADESQIDGVLAVDTNSENPLLSACQAIGDVLGISMQSHPDARGGHKQTPQDIAETSGVRVRKVILTPDWWRRDNGPILAYLLDEETTDGLRPIALLPTSDHSYDLYDSVKRNRTPVTPEVAATINPAGYTFLRSFSAKALTALDLVKFGVRGLGRAIGTILLMGLLGGLLGLLTPMVMGMIYDNIIPNTQKRQLVYIALALFAGAFGSALFQLTQSLATLRVSSKVESVLQAAQWDRLMSLPSSFFRQFTVGDLAQRSMGISQIRATLSGTAVSSIISSIFSVFNFGLMFYYNWKLSLVATGLSVIYAVTLTLLGYLQVLRQAELLELEGKIAGSLLGFIGGISKLRVAGAEVSAFGVWAKTFSAQRKVGFKVGTIGNVLAVVNSIFSPLATMVIFWYLTKQILGPQPSGAVAGAILSTGQFLAFTSAYGSFQTSLVSVSLSIIQILSIVPQWRRAKPILETEPERGSADKDPGELYGDIEINHVSFRYTSDGPLVLDDISLRIQPGEFVAFVGPSGSGKSTCLRLLLAFESPESGSISYDHQDLASLAPHRVRRQIGVVLQQSNLATGDLFSNIVGSSTELTIDDAWDAVRMAGLDKDIEEMPMGLHTVVSEGASTFSGGQRQRLLIARALVRKPRILFFDEATSALDNETQAIVTRSLETLPVARIAVAHRLSTIQGADKIYVFDKGKIVQHGTYDELISQPGTFAGLAKRQIA